VAVKRGKSIAASGWSPRVAGVLLCAFFILGVATGFSDPGRALAARVSRACKRWVAQISEYTEPVRNAAGQSIAPIERLAGLRRTQSRSLDGDGASFVRDTSPNRAAALIRSPDGFYMLTSHGDLRGPLSAAAQPDLPIISGAGLGHADGATLLKYAAMMVRAEAQLQSVISETRIESDGVATMFLDRPRVELVVDLNDEALELRRAAQVLERWHGRERAISMIDMTANDLAIVRLRTPLKMSSARPTRVAAASDRHAGAVRVAQRSPYTP